MLITMKIDYAVAAKARSDAAKSRVEERKNDKVPFLVRKAEAGFLLTGDPAGNDDLVEKLIAAGVLDARKLGRLTMVTYQSIQDAVQNLPKAVYRQR